MENKFIGIEDEITLRLSIRKVYAHEGMIGIYKAMGELVQSLNIMQDVAIEILTEENKQKERDSK